MDLGADWGVESERPVARDQHYVPDPPEENFDPPGRKFRAVLPHYA